MIPRNVRTASMSVVSERGEAIRLQGGLTVREENIIRGRDITIVHLRAKGLPWRDIALFLGMSKSNVHYRFNRLSRSTREEYAHLSPLA